MGVTSYVSKMFVVIILVQRPVRYPVSDYRLSWLVIFLLYLLDGKNIVTVIIFPPLIPGRWEIYVTMKVSFKAEANKWSST